MPGDDWQRLANLRLLYGYQFGQPGKKLLFMGDEIGQWREWDHESETRLGVVGPSCSRRRHELGARPQLADRAATQRCTNATPTLEVSPGRSRMTLRPACSASCDSPGTAIPC